MTGVFEHLTTTTLDRRADAETAPIRPVLGTGVVPLLQWLLLALLALLALSLARRELFGTIHINALSGK